MYVHVQGLIKLSTKREPYVVYIYDYVDTIIECKH